MLDSDAVKIAGLKSLIEAASRIRIVVHTHPDGDALGSGTALETYLRETWGKDALLMLPDPAPDTLSFLRPEGVAMAASLDPQKAGEELSGADLIMVLDLNRLQRTECLEGPLTASPAKKVLIDHHLDPDRNAFDLVFSCTEVSSTCELLYFIIKELEGGSLARVPARSLYALMTGMTTDTNNFANSVFPATLQMAGELLAAGVDRDDILRNLYDSDREERLRAFADILSRKLVILPCGLAYIVLTKEEMDAYSLKEGETEGLVNFPLRVEKVKLSVFLREQDGVFRASVRSKKGWSANAFATLFFHGGGHLQAAGGKLLWPGDIAERGDAAPYIEKAAARFMQK